jgi:trehalose/maltose hydrolase-like predicted phosphorylase
VNDALRIGSFSIEMDAVTPKNQAFCESVFSQGNGYLGVRGYDPLGVKPNDHARSVFLAGVFEYIKPGITDMVNAPDLFSARLLTAAQETSASLHLDLQTGLWQRASRWETADGAAFAVATQRVVSMANPHLTAMRIVITALDAPLPIALQLGLDDQVANLPISDDQMTQNTQALRLLHPVDAASSAIGGSLIMQSAPSGRRLYQAYQVRTIGGQTVAGERAFTTIEAQITPENPLVIEQFAATYTYRDHESDPLASARALCEAAAGEGFAAVQAASAAAWARLWEQCDIRVDADPSLQGAIRYNIFQLLQNNAAHDPRASIGARGLMHGRYKGNYFWDTELFMLPFYLYTRPQAAKNLLHYRHHTLPDALQGAKNMGLRGARYPWMCSDTGFEQCETWDTGCCEIHITADVAYAVNHYLRATGDREFFLQCGAEMLLQTARYWQSRLTYAAQDDRYNLLFVKGPDEYCGVTSNNTYTNYLCQENLLSAALAGETLQQADPTRWQSLCEAHGFSTAELAAFRDTAGKIPLPYDPARDLYLEDDLFEKLEPLDITTHKHSDAALYRSMSYDRLQRYQVLKQADLVLLMTLCPDAFTHQQKANIYEYYEPKTLHDSTLSFGTHAQLAFRLGKEADAMRYFEKSVYLDLKDIMQNTAGEGIHMAALGASWQAILFGMLGLTLKDGAPAIAPRLNEAIRAIDTQVVIGGKAYHLHADAAGASVEPL